MFLNIKEMPRALCFNNSVTNNNLFGRQASFFIIGFSNDIEAQRCITCN
ncbi:acyl dehydratase [Bacillus wiedmannii]